MKSFTTTASQLIQSTLVQINAAYSVAAAVVAQFADRLLPWQLFVARHLNNRVSRENLQCSAVNLYINLVGTPQPKLRIKQRNCRLSSQGYDAHAESEWDKQIRYRFVPSTC